MKKRIIFIISLFLLPLVIIFFASFYFYYEGLVSIKNNLSTYSTFVVEEGSTVNNIAEQLFKEKIIPSKFVFKLYLKLNKLDIVLQAGEYEIPPNSNIKEVVEILQNGFFDRKITFYEGERIEQYAIRAAVTITKTESEKTEFINKFLDYSETKEGYLFPDTYSYNSSTTPKGLVDWMRARFVEVVTPVLSQNNSGLNSNEVIILASIVEREGNSAEDRGIIAGILINRLNAGIALYADATSQYQIDLDIIELNSGIIENVQFWKAPITKDYLDSNSPFNTRKTSGLPPAPICNPSIESIKAVANYTKTNYLYYIHDNNGEAHYAETLDEHNINVSKYLGYN